MRIYHFHLHESGTLQMISNIFVFTKKLFYPVCSNFPNYLHCIVIFEKLCYSRIANACSIMKGANIMSSVDQIIKNLIIEQVQKTNDKDLLDLIYKLLISEG